MPSALKGQSLTTSPTTLFNSATDGTGVIGYSVTNRSSSASYVLLTIAGLVTDFPIAPGDSQVFRLGNSNSSVFITTVSCKTDAATATIDCGVVAKGHPPFSSGVQ